MNKTSCRVQTLTEGDLTKIAFCHDCQVFHLQIGYATLHIHPEAFASLGTSIGSALAVYRRQNADTDSTRPNTATEPKTPLH